MFSFLKRLFTNKNKETKEETIIPLKREFLSIYKQNYILNKNDCSNKAGKYLKLLIDNNYNAKIIIVKPRGSSFLHAIVQVSFDDNKFHYYDPTLGTHSNKISTFGEYRSTLTIDDIQNSQMFI